MNDKYSPTANLDNYENIPQPKFKNQLPKPTGGNKLTESMISGYTGYIPSRKFNYSNTYRVECDNCIDDLVTSKNEKNRKEVNIVDTVTYAPKHTLITTGFELKKELDNFKDSSLQFKVLNREF